MEVILIKLEIIIVIIINLMKILTLTIATTIYHPHKREIQTEVIYTFLKAEIQQQISYINYMYLQSRF